MTCLLPLLIGCGLTFAVGAVWLWRRERKKDAEVSHLIKTSFDYGYDVGRKTALGTRLAKQKIAIVEEYECGPILAAIVEGGKPG